ncbi:SCO2322 family protein [Streptomyces sp. NBC_00212]|uniref:SCO2322 family protein n=1 Tax=Streptomyces sp. NBC_00212 TaxID=2975684 RepID=UPI00324FD2F0
MRTRLASFAALLLTLVALAAGTGSAQAAGYRYWSFWDLAGDNWTYATQGPASAHPGDGSVQGFRFAVSADSKDASQPRTTPSFEAVCAATPTKDGTKRVALVIDFGTPQDANQGETPPAPRTACAQVSPDATSADALAAVAKPLRYNSAALLCAIADYPRTGCGEQVANPSAAKPAEPAKTEHDSGPSVGLLAGVAAVVALGAAAIWQSRRRKN